MTNQEYIQRYFVAQGFPDLFSNFLAAQAAHETGNFTSNLFKNYHNAYGYKYVNSIWQSGPATRSPEGDYYANYYRLDDSINEIIDWIERRQKEKIFPEDLRTVTSTRQFATLLKNAGYYGATIDSYTKGLDNYYMDFSLAGSTAPLLLLIGFAVTVYLFLK